MLPANVHRAHVVAVALEPARRTMKMATVSALGMVVWRGHGLTGAPHRGQWRGSPRIHRLHLRPDEALPVRYIVEEAAPRPRIDHAVTPLVALCSKPASDSKTISEQPYSTATHQFVRYVVLYLLAQASFLPADTPILRRRWSNRFV